MHTFTIIFLGNKRMRSSALLGKEGNFNSMILMSKRSASGLSGDLPYSLRELHEDFLELPVGCETQRESDYSPASFESAKSLLFLVLNFL